MPKTQVSKPNHVKFDRDIFNKLGTHDVQVVTDTKAISPVPGAVYSNSLAQDDSLKTLAASLAYANPRLAEFGQTLQKEQDEGDVAKATKDAASGNYDNQNNSRAYQKKYWEIDAGYKAVQMEKEYIDLDAKAKSLGPDEYNAASKAIQDKYLSDKHPDDYMNAFVPHALKIQDHFAQRFQTQLNKTMQEDSMSKLNGTLLNQIDAAAKSGEAFTPEYPKTLKALIEGHVSNAKGIGVGANDARKFFMNAVGEYVKGTRDTRYGSLLAYLDEPDAKNPERRSTNDPEVAKYRNDTINSLTFLAHQTESFERDKRLQAGHKVMADLASEIYAAGKEADPETKLGFMGKIDQVLTNETGEYELNHTQRATLLTLRRRVQTGRPEQSDPKVYESLLVRKANDNLRASNVLAQSADLNDEDFDYFLKSCRDGVAGVESKDVQASRAMISRERQNIKARIFKNDDDYENPEKVRIYTDYTRNFDRTVGRFEFKRSFDVDSIVKQSEDAYEKAMKNRKEQDKPGYNKGDSKNPDAKATQKARANIEKRAKQKRRDNNAE